MLDNMPSDTSADDILDAVDPEDDELDDEDTPTVSRSEALRRRRIANGRGKMVSNSRVVSTPNLTRGGAPKRILAQQKRRDAIELRKAGLTYQAIADHVGYPSASEAAKQVKKALAEVIQEPVDEVRRIQIERLNHLLTLAWQEANTSKSLSAINTALTIMARIDVLEGTESARKVEVSQTTINALIATTASEDEFIQQFQKFLSVNPDGSNAGTTAPPPTALPAIPAPNPAAMPSKYPPGMGIPAAPPDPLPTTIVVAENLPTTPEELAQPVAVAVTDAQAGEVVTMQFGTPTTRGRFAVVADDEE